MYQLSDSDTPDSDDGRRFKTESTRKTIHKSERNYTKYRAPSPRRNSDRRDRRRSRSPRRENRDKVHKESRSRRYDDHSKSSRSKAEENTISHNRGKSKNEERGSSSNKSDRSIKKEEKKEKYNGVTTDIVKVDNYGPTPPPILTRTKETNIEMSNSCDKESNQKLNNSHEEDAGLCNRISPLALKRKDTTEDCGTSQAYGPSLPPSLLTQKEETQIPADKEKDTKNSDMDLLSMSSTDINPEESVERNVYIGPTLPSHLREKLANAAEEIPHIEEQEEEEEGEIEIYGPLPPGLMQNTQAHIALEERALQMKIDTLAGPCEDTARREEWMLELPAVRSANLGLGPRQFRAKPTPDMSNRSSWTETPEDKLKKQSGQKIEVVDIRKDAEIKEIRKRDEEQEKMIKKHKKSSKRDDKSLLEIHQSKLKDKGEEGPAVRRPFSRDVDLKVNRFDDAQKKAILKKAQLLDSRFSKGQSKFL